MSDRRKSPGKEEIEMDDLNKKPGGMSSVLDITDSEPTEEDEEFKSLRKKYYQVSKDIRMDAIEEEKKELGQSESSPKVKYYEGSKNDRIKLLDEIKRQMEELESISKGKK
ncbi:hypothetical protein V9T40_014680 [Parthenolecanium corni]|uniref:Uncharacterized protein n=1 Tax=Parthenolecanium corni TaxID=536013 RepID=A0AAN9T6G4_9HEMI